MKCRPDPAQLPPAVAALLTPAFRLSRREDAAGTATAGLLGEVGAGQNSLQKQVLGALCSGRGEPQDCMALTPGGAGVWQQRGWERWLGTPVMSVGSLPSPAGLREALPAQRPEAHQRHGVWKRSRGNPRGTWVCQLPGELSALRRLKSEVHTVCMCLA